MVILHNEYFYLSQIFNAGLSLVMEHLYIVVSL